MYCFFLNAQPAITCLKLTTKGEICLYLTNKHIPPFSSVAIVNSEQVNAGWVSASAKPMMKTRFAFHWTPCDIKWDSSLEHQFFLGKAKNELGKLKWYIFETWWEEYADLRTFLNTYRHVSFISQLAVLLWTWTFYQEALYAKEAKGNAILDFHWHL